LQYRQERRLLSGKISETCSRSHLDRALSPVFSIVLGMGLHEEVPTIRISLLEVKMVSFHVAWRGLWDEECPLCHSMIDTSLQKEVHLLMPPQVHHTSGDVH